MQPSAPTLSKNWFPCVLLWLILGTGACAAELGDDTEPADPIGGLSQAIVNGTPVNADGGAVVRVQHFGSDGRWHICSGILVRNDIILTARHCMSANDTIDGPVDGTLSHYGAQVPSAFRNISRVIPIPGAGNDVGVLVASSNFPVNNGGVISEINQKLSVTSVSTQGLSGQDLLCAGYGGGANTQVKTAVLRFEWRGTNELFGDPGPMGLGVFEKGDSGGPCIRFQAGNPTVAAIASRQAVVVGPDTFRTWLNQTVCSFSKVPNACIP
jgi:hypothetical protein